MGRYKFIELTKREFSEQMWSAPPLGLELNRTLLDYAGVLYEREDLVEAPLVPWKLSEFYRRFEPREGVDQGTLWQRVKKFFNSPEKKFSGAMSKQEEVLKKRPFDDFNEKKKPAEYDWRHIRLRDVAGVLSNCSGLSYDSRLRLAERHGFGKRTMKHHVPVYDITLKLDQRFGVYEAKTLRDHTLLMLIIQDMKSAPGAIRPIPHVASYPHPEALPARIKEYIEQRKEDDPRVKHYWVRFLGLDYGGDSEEDEAIVDDPSKSVNLEY